MSAQCWCYPGNTAESTASWRRLGCPKPPTPLDRCPSHGSAVNVRADSAPDAKLEALIAWMEQEATFVRERFDSDPCDEFWNGCLTAINDDLAAARLILHGEPPTEPRSYL